MHIRTSIAAACLLTFATATAGRADDADTAMKTATPHHVYLIGTLRITQPYLDLTGGSADGVGAYLTIENRSTAPDKLIGGSLEGGGALVVPPGEEADGLTIPPSGHLTLQPGASHLTLSGRQGLTSDGPPLGGTLRFEKAGVLHVAFDRTPAQAASDDQTAPAAVEKPVNLAQ